MNLSVRAIAGAALVAQQTLRRCDLDADQAVAMNRAADELSTLPLRILDTGRLRLSEFVGIAARERMRGGLLAAVIDYLQLLKPDERSDSREREVSEVARGLKGLALDLGVPLLALSQLNRACETRPNKRPMMSDLRESGEIEQAADLVTFLYRDEVYNKTSPDKGIAEWIIAKQKDGPLGPVRLAWQAECTRFDDLAPGDGDTAPDAHASFDDFTHETDEDP